MQLAELLVEGLFGKYDHRVAFPTSAEDESSPSLTILHGPNGIGKTTLLRMLAGAMELNFDTFRIIPFSHFRLTFNSEDELDVRLKPGKGIEVSFRGLSALLAVDKKGAANDRDKPSVNALRDRFSQTTEGISLTYVDANRVLDSDIRLTSGRDTVSPRVAQDLARLYGRYGRKIQPYGFDIDLSDADRALLRRPPDLIAEKIQRFVNEAQLDYRQFFTTREPDLLPRIIENIRAQGDSIPSKADIEGELQRIHEQERIYHRLGITQERWDYKELRKMLAEIGEGPNDLYALVAFNTYVEFLAARANAKQLLAERLLTFEEVMSSFFKDKNVSINGRSGLQIKTDDDVELDESQLSSGEYQLLFLMVAALTTRRRGTIIAIDEPELSIHIAWQTKLVSNLIKCASRAAPQLILATHSPDIAASYPESMVKLNRGEG